LEQTSPIQVHPYFCSTRAIKSESYDKLKEVINKNRDIEIQYNLLFDNSDFENVKLKTKIQELTNLIINVSR
jgi:hypothetical protein